MLQNEAEQTAEDGVGGERVDLRDVLEFIIAVMFPLIATICGVTAIIYPFIVSSAL